MANKPKEKDINDLNDHLDRIAERLGQQQAEGLYESLKASEGIASATNKLAKLGIQSDINDIKKHMDEATGADRAKLALDLQTKEALEKAFENPASKHPVELTQRYVNQALKDLAAQFQMDTLAHYQKSMRQDYEAKTANIDRNNKVEMQKAIQQVDDGLTAFEKSIGDKNGDKAAQERWAKGVEIVKQNTLKPGAYVPPPEGLPNLAESALHVDPEAMLKPASTPKVAQGGLVQPTKGAAV